MASTSEAITSAFIEAALNVYRNMLSDTKCLNLLQAMEQKWSPSPLNSIYKLQILVSKADKEQNIMRGYLHFIFDAVETKEAWCASNIHPRTHPTIEHSTNRPSTHPPRQ